VTLPAHTVTVPKNKNTYKKKFLNCDGQQFHHYQQNEQPPQLTEHKHKKTTYDVGNPGPVL
jgi:hypothetical protein